MLAVLGGGAKVPESTLEEREKRASVGIAASFVVLAFVVGGVACSHLGSHEVPTNLGALIGLAAPSAIVFGVLGGLKWWVGIATSSASLKKDAACSLCGSALSLGVCFGAAAVAGTDGSLWWFDALVALLVSFGLLIYGSYSLHRNARAGNRWWTCSFWTTAGRTNTAAPKMVQVIEARPSAGLEGAGPQPVAEDRVARRQEVV